MTDLRTTNWPAVADLPGLYPHQRDRLAAATARRLGLLTGKPGTGKTHTLGVLVAAIVNKYGRESVAVAAPTGKAAVRITQALRKAGVESITAKTIHSLLEIDRNGHDGDGWGFKRNERNPLDAKYIFIDESSMLDTDLAAALLGACGWGAHVLLTGDTYQLPPVGHGCPLRDLTAAGVPNGELTEIHRNAGAIVRACHAIAAERPWTPARVSDGERVYPGGIVPALNADGITPDTNLWHFEESNEKRTAGIVEQLATAAARVYGLENVAVLVPTHKGDLGRIALNARLQTAFNAAGEKAPGGSNPFRVGDPVICLRNGWHPDAVIPRTDHYLANGETGIVREVSDRAAVATFTRPNREVKFNVSKTKPPDDANGDSDEDNGKGRTDFDLAYAITGHKSQGSEWPVVIVVADGSAGARRVASREWLYTALSRASVLCITVGKLSVVEQAARRPALVRRRTFLRELMTEGIL